MAPARIVEFPIVLQGKHNDGKHNEGKHNACSQQKPAGVVCTGAAVAEHMRAGTELYRYLSYL